MQWYYGKEGRQFGPIEEAELFRLAQSGELAPTDLVWNATMGQNWVEASTVPNLFVSPPARPRYYAGDGNTPNRGLMRRARESLEGHWGISVGGMALVMIILMAAGGVMRLSSIIWEGGFNRSAGSVLSLIVGGPFALGCAVFFLTLVRGAEPKIG